MLTEGERAEKANELARIRYRLALRREALEKGAYDNMVFPVAMFGVLCFAVGVLVGVLTAGY